MEIVRLKKTQLQPKKSGASRKYDFDALGVGEALVVKMMNAFADTPRAANRSCYNLAGTYNKNNPKKKIIMRFTVDGALVAYRER